MNGLAQTRAALVGKPAAQSLACRSLSFARLAGLTIRSSGWLRAACGKLAGIAAAAA